MPYQTHHHHRTFIHLLGLLLLTSLFLHPHTSTAQTSPPSSDNYGSSLPTSAIIIIAVVFVLCCLACFIRPFVVCFRAYVFGGTDDGGEDDNNRLRRRETARGLDPTVLATFPTYIVSDVKVHVDSKTTPLECAVCLNEFVDHDLLRLLPRCSHVFHPHCIAPWFVSHVTCPVCRANLEIQVDSQHPLQSLGQVLQRPSEGELEPWDQTTEPGDEDDVIVHVGSSPETMIKSPKVDTTNGVNERRGFFPRSHSTGHSIVEDRERYTLRLSEEVRNKLVNVNSLSGTSPPAAVISPRTRYRSRRSNSCATIPEKPDRWRFTMSPPFISRPSSPVTGGGSNNNNNNNINNNNNNYLVEMMRRSPRSLFKSMKSPSKSPLNRVVRCDDIGERSSDKLWPNLTSQELELEGH